MKDDNTRASQADIDPGVDSAAAAPARVASAGGPGMTEPSTEGGLFARNTVRVTLLSLGGWTLVNADNSLFNLNYPLIQDSLHISDAQIGYIYAIVYAIGALSTFVAGPIMDRMGRKPVYQACLLAAVVGSILTAGAPGLLILIVARSFTQIGASTEWMAGQVLVAEEAPAAVRGRLIGFAQIGYPLGFFLGSIVSFLVVPLVGWRILFLFGVAPVAMMIWARRAVPESGRFRRLDNGKRHKAHFAQIFAPDLRRSSIAVTVWHLFYAFGFGAIVSFLPTVYSHYNISLDRVYLSSAIATGLAAFGYILCAYVGEMIGRREASAIWLTLGGASGLYMSLGGTSWLTLTIGYSLIYFFVVGHITSAVGFTAEVFPTRVRGTGANLVAGVEWIGFFCAALVGPHMLNSMGVSTSLLIWLFICPIIAAAAAMSMRRVAPRTVLEEIAR